MAREVKYYYESGQVVGNAIFLKYDGTIRDTKRDSIAGIFICVCGNNFRAATNKVRCGNIKSCGCFIKKAKNKTHGRTNTPEYKSWSCAKSRCYSEKDGRYYSHGGRGIVMCEGWINSFISFYEDMGERPSKDHSLDRINNDMNYSCGHCNECKENKWGLNCRWATDDIQNNNKQTNRFITFNNKTLTIAQWAKNIGIPRVRIGDRLNMGWSPEDCLNPIKLTNKTKIHCKN